MKVIGTQHDWRVRPVRTETGRVQSYAVEHRIHDDIWRSTACVANHARAMELATHMAHNFLVVR